MVWHVDGSVGLLNARSLPRRRRAHDWTYVLVLRRDGSNQRGDEQLHYGMQNAIWLDRDRDPVKSWEG